MAMNLIQTKELHSGQVLEIRLAQPPANILSAQAMSEIASALEEAKKRPLLKLIMFSAEGKHFSFGASVEEHLPGQVDSMLPGFHRLIDQILSFPIPTLARVTGLCLGGGFELALACSFIFADEAAQFAVPEVTLSVFPPVASALLPLLGAGALAPQMVVTGDKFSSDQLIKHGILTQISTAGSIDHDISSFIEKKILSKSAIALKYAHAAVREPILQGYRKSISVLEKMYLIDLMKTKDANEGLKAFIEKRNPSWSNQ